MNSATILNLSKRLQQRLCLIMGKALVGLCLLTEPTSAACESEAARYQVAAESHRLAEERHQVALVREKRAEENLRKNWTDPMAARELQLAKLEVRATEDALAVVTIELNASQAALASCEQNTM